MARSLRSGILFCMLRPFPGNTYIIHWLPRCPAGRALALALMLC